MSGPRVYVANLVTQPGETDGYDVARHLAELRDYAGEVEVDVIIVNSTPLPLEVALGGALRLGRSYTAPVFDPLLLATRRVHVTVAAESMFAIADSAVFDSATGRFVPVLCGSALRNGGVPQLLDAVCAHLPSPLDVAAPAATNAAPGAPEMPMRRALPA